MDDVNLFATNGISPIAGPVVLTPTNSVWGGDTLTFTVSCFGSPKLGYQWQTDGGNSGGALTNIDGATTNFLAVVTTTNAGTYSYQVIITNSFGSVTSAVVVLCRAGASGTIHHPGHRHGGIGTITNLLGFIGGNVNLYTVVAGAPPVTNQWLVKLDSGGGYTNIVGATNGLRVLTVQSTSSGNYYMGATNAFGSINSTPAHLTPLADPAAPASNGVTNMYANCIMTNHPWAYWKFEETNDSITSSMQAYDYSGHNYHATYGNSDGTSGSGCKDGGESLPQYGPMALMLGLPAPTCVRRCHTIIITGISVCRR